MKLNRTFALIAATITSLTIATSASAEVLTFIGTVGAGAVDLYDTWGAGQTGISGLDFKMIFNVNPANGRYFSGTSNGGNFVSALGGAYYADISPVSATLTINNHTETFGSWLGVDRVDQQSLPSSAMSVEAWNDFYNNIQAGAYAYDLSTFPLSLSSSYDFAVGGTGPVFAYANFHLYDPDPVDTHGSLVITHISSVADVTAAVPEPSTWAMMILGFAGIGFMAYRRRNSAILAA